MIKFIKLKENFSTGFTVSYDIHKKSDNSTYVDAFENFSISMITPRELFRKKDYKTYTFKKGSNPFTPFRQMLKELYMKDSPTCQDMRNM